MHAVCSQQDPRGTLRQIATTVLKMSPKKTDLEIMLDGGFLLVLLFRWQFVGFALFTAMRTDYITTSFT